MTTLSLYPDVTVEEAERLYQYLSEQHGMTLDDVAGACNTSVVYANDLPANALMWACLLFIFVYAEDWPEGEQRIPYSAHPDWVNELYHRASGCEGSEDRLLLSGARALV